MKTFPLLPARQLLRTSLSAVELNHLALNVLTRPNGPRLLERFTVSDLATMSSSVKPDLAARLQAMSPRDLGASYFIKTKPKVFVFAGFSAARAAEDIAARTGHVGVYCADAPPTRMGDWQTSITARDSGWQPGGMNFQMTVRRAGHPDRIDALHVDEHFKVTHVRGTPEAGAPARAPRAAISDEFVRDLMNNPG